VVSFESLGGVTVFYRVCNRNDTVRRAVLWAQQVSCIAAATLLASSLAIAQPRKQSRKPPAGPHILFRVTSEEVVLNCNVLNHKGKLMNGLQKDDFRVWDNAVPQKIISVQQTDSPVSIGLLVDDSGSMRPRRAAVTKAALDLIQASNPDDQTFVVNFADQAYLDQDFTASPDRLRSSLSHPSMMGGTAIYDTVITAAKKLEHTAARPRKVIVLITDGEDNASKATLSQAIRQVQDLRGPVIYSIGLLFDQETGDQERKARHDLQALSDQTGGIAFFPKSAGQIDAVAKEVAQAIRNQYTLAYRANRGAGAGSFHTVKVSAKAKGYPRLIVHTRPGYWEPAK
jgi:Ca-activated chloride channel family protein